MTAYDERLYGIAPTERDVHGGTVYLTMFGVMRALDISEATMRRNPGLMALRKVLGANTFRWIESDVQAYVAAQSATPKPTRAEMRARIGTVTRQARRTKREKAERGKAGDSALQSLMAARLAAYHAGGTRGTSEEADA